MNNNVRKTTIIIIKWKWPATSIERKYNNHTATYGGVYGWSFAVGNFAQFCANWAARRLR